MDGYGLGKPEAGNAIYAAATPALDDLFSRNPNTRLSASGEDVGLPDGQMGNSEVGHTNIGAGRVVYQELTRISKAIKDGVFFQNPVYANAMDACKKSGAALHIMGLLSDGGVHSHNTHLYALLEMAKRSGLEKGLYTCLPRRTRREPDDGSWFCARMRRKVRQRWSGNNCHSYGAVLCHGQGQTLGSSGKSLCRNGIRRRRFCKRSRQSGGK